MLKRTKKIFWWLITIVLGIATTANWFIPDPLPLVDELIMSLITFISLIKSWRGEK